MFIDLAIAAPTIALNIGRSSSPYAYAGYRFLSSSSLADCSAKVASDINWLIQQPYNYFSSVNFSSITGVSQCIEKSISNQTYTLIDKLTAKPAVDWAFEKVNQADCLWEFGKNGYYLGMGVSFTIANMCLFDKLISAVNRAVNKSNDVYKYTKGLADSACTIYSKIKTVLNPDASKLSTSKEVKLTEEDQAQVLKMFQKLSRIGGISITKVFPHNNKVNLRFEVEGSLDDFLAQIKTHGIEPASITQDENQKALLATISSGENFRFQVVSKSS